jgi:hypothetical protein
MRLPLRRIGAVAKALLNFAYRIDASRVLAMSTRGTAGRLLGGVTIVLLSLTAFTVEERVVRGIATRRVARESAVKVSQPVARESAVKVSQPVVRERAGVESQPVARESAVKVSQPVVRENAVSASSKPNSEDADADFSPQSTTLAAYRPILFTDHPSVQKYVRYFSQDSSGKRTFQQWLERASQYKEMIDAALDREGLPRDLMAVALIESGLDPRAVSPVGATGMWQFIEATGTLYGLAHTDELDQRRAPLLSTQAAARYLRELYDQFQDWPLALASYNAGPGRVRQLLEATTSYDFWSVAARSVELPEETLRYVPKVLAAMTILRRPRAYGFEPIEGRKAPAFVPLTIPPATSIELLAKVLALPIDDLREANPELLVDYVPTAQDTNVVRIPESRAKLSELVFGTTGDDVEGGVLSALGHVVAPEFAFERARCFPRRCRGNKDARGWKQLRETLDAASRRIYLVKPGDSLEKVAALFNVSARQLMSENGIRNPRSLRIGQTLRVPGSETL